MTKLIIIQVLIAVIGGGGSVAGLILLPGKQKIIAGVILAICIVGSVLLWKG